MNKKDFSKNCLSQALIDLLKDHEYQDISIQDIVDKAGFSRMAYYRNFKSKDEMIDYYLESCIDAFIKDADLSYQRMGSSLFFTTFFNYFSTDEMKKLSGTLYKRGLILRLAAQFFKHAKGGFVPNQSEYFYNFISGGIFSVYITWMINGYKETPEQMAEEARRFTEIVKGIQH